MIGVMLDEVAIDYAEYLKVDNQNEVKNYFESNVPSGVVNGLSDFRPLRMFRPRAAGAPRQLPLLPIMVSTELPLG